jgi:DNA-binding CsgD family transcriptional regulator
MLNARSPDDRAAESRRALALGGLSAIQFARHLALLAQNLALAGRFAEAEGVLERAGAEPAASGDDAAGHAAALAEVLLEEAHGHHDRALSLAHAGRSFPATIFAKTGDGALRLAYARLLAVGGDLDRGLELMEAGMGRAERDGQRWLLALWGSARARLLLEAGDLSGARAAADAAMAAGTGRSELVADPDAAILLGRMARHTGDGRGVRAAVRAARDLHEHGVPAVRRHAAWLLALAAFDSDRPREAVAWLCDDDELPYAAPACEVTHAPTVVRIALAADAPALAAAAVERAERTALGSAGNVLLRAVAAHARALLDGDADALRGAVALLRDVHRPLLLAEALEDAAAALMLARRREEAASCAAEALSVWDGAGAAADARRVRRRLRTLGVHHRAAARVRPRKGWQSLTDAELRVVHLVAAGHTNRQVADRLVLSPHTVSTHLRHAFGKLRINSRVELARIALDRGLHESSAA